MSEKIRDNLIVRNLWNEEEGKRKTGVSYDQISPGICKRGSPLIQR